MAVTLLYLVRHAQPEPAEDVEDPALSDVGERQATALGERLRRVPVTELHHGPSRRTTGTARQLAAAMPGVVPQVSDHLRDRTPVPSSAHRSSMSVPHLSWLRSVPAVEQGMDGVAIDAALGANAPLSLLAYNDVGHLTGGLRTGAPLQLEL